MLAVQHTPSLPPTSRPRPMISSSSRGPRPPTPPPSHPPMLRRSSSSSSSSPTILSFLHSSPSSTQHTPIPKRLQSSPLITCEKSPFHRRSISSSLSASPEGRMTPLPEVEGEVEAVGSHWPKKEGDKCEGFEKRVEGLLFPRENLGGRHFD